MKSAYFSVFAIVMFTMASISCSDTTGGKSTPIDETKENGVAPVQQTEGMPATTIDTTMQRMNSQNTTARNTARTDTSTMPPHASTGSGTSNTTDSRTTSGSNNKGK
jgi:cell shape-determining protein MreC